jgi:hypothetical protein
MDPDRGPHVSINSDVEFSLHGQFALMFHRQWCSTPFCDDINADDWTEASIALMMVKRRDLDQSVDW